MSIEPYGIVRLSWTAGTRITARLAVGAMAAVDELNSDRRRPLLVEMNSAGTPTREARVHFGRPCTASRIALLGKSPVDRMHASFTPHLDAVGFPVPTRFFTSEPSAMAWLLPTGSDQ